MHQNGLIGDISILLEEEITSLKKDVIQCMQEEHASVELISNVNKLFSEKIAVTLFEGLQTAYLQKNISLTIFICWYEYQTNIMCMPDILCIYFRNQ